MNASVNDCRCDGKLRTLVVCQPMVDCGRPAFPGRWTARGQRPWPNRYSCQSSPVRRHGRTARPPAGHLSNRCHAKPRGHPTTKLETRDLAQPAVIEITVSRRQGLPCNPAARRSEQKCQHLSRRPHAPKKVKEQFAQALRPGIDGDRKSEGNSIGYRSGKNRRRTEVRMSGRRTAARARRGDPANVAIKRRSATGGPRAQG